MIVLDTTVLVYAKGLEHPLRDPCRALIDRIGQGLVRASTTVEVIQEFLHVRARRTSREEAAMLALAYVELLAPLMVVSADHLRDGVRLYTATPRLGAFDAVLCAAALDHGAAAIVSADRASSGVAGLPHLGPVAALELVD